MKIKSLAFALCLWACDGTPIGVDEPALFNYFFQLTSNLEGVDVEFFSSNPSYDYKLLTLKDDSGQIMFDSAYNNVPIRSNQLIDLKRFFEGSQAIATSTNFLKVYFDYGNGDIDTLTQTRIPAKTNGSVTQVPDTAFFHFNGQLIFKYAFKSNFREIAYRNSPSYFYEQDEFKPIIFTINKTAER